MQKEPRQFLGRVRPSMKTEDKGSFDQLQGLRQRKKFNKVRLQKRRYFRASVFKRNLCFSRVRASLSPHRLSSCSILTATQNWRFKMFWDILHHIEWSTKPICFATTISDQSQFNFRSGIKQSSQGAAMFAGRWEQWLQLWCAGLGSQGCRGHRDGQRVASEGHWSWAGHTESKRIPQVYLRNQQLYTSWICTPECCVRLIYFCLVRAMIDTNLTSDRIQIKSLVPTAAGVLTIL